MGYRVYALPRSTTQFFLDLSTFHSQRNPLPKLSHLLAKKHSGTPLPNRLLLYLLQRLMLSLRSELQKEGRKVRPG